PDPEHGGHRLIATTRRAGVTYRTPFDAAFLRSSDWQRLSTLSTQMAAIGGRGSLRIEGGEGEEPELVPSALRLLEQLLERAKKGPSIQRYQGLRERNPDQPAATTMGPHQPPLPPA